MIVAPLTLLAFIPAGLAFNLTPGADMMFWLGQGLRAGPRAALAAEAGTAPGVFTGRLGQRLLSSCRVPRFGWAGRWPQYFWASPPDWSCCKGAEIVPH